jgi:creatinine amidohydrolase
MPKLVDLTWPEVEAVNRDKTVVMIPIGAIEQHGPHLPINTDILIAEYFADELSRVVPARANIDVLVAPSIPYTYAKPSTVLPGTMSVRGDVFIHYVRDILRDFIRQGFTKIAFVNSHYENTDFLLEAADQATEGLTNTKILMVIWWEFCAEDVLREISGGVYQGAKSDHAAVIETAIVLAAAPQVVRQEKLVAADDKAPPYRGFRVVPWDRTRWPRTGVFSVASKSTSDMGRRVVDYALDGMREFICREFG